MTVNIQYELQESEFYRKKFQRAMEVRDANKDGFIQRSDFMMVVKRYKELGATDEHLKKMTSAFEEGWKMWGLVDDSTALTYDEFASKHMQAMAEFSKEGAVKLFSGMFETTDLDGNGEISFKEWEDHYKALGVNIAYARASFDAMDADGNGVVSKEEFVAYNIEFFYSTEDKLNSSIMYGPLDQ
jgi:Ca2+-binding EF-hand superfamily protein